MDFDLRNRLDGTSLRLHERARALAHPDRDHDMSSMMSAMALALESMRALADDIASIEARLGRQ
jgi:hypothetical protein